MPPDIIQTRSARTEDVLGRVRTAFLEQLGSQRDATVGTHTTIYATGSCGRGDMGAGSDLDPYVVCLEDELVNPPAANAADVIAAALDSAVVQAGLPELDRDGEYARRVTAKSLFEHLGGPEDDGTNALTRRMLLLLESRPFVNREAYDRLIKMTIGAYWKNAGQHPDDYLPIVLVNDIVRYWRIVLLNHESRLREKSKKAPLSPEEQMALRRYSSYKLRVPRCLSCFSALAYLLAMTPTESAHVSHEDIIRMTDMTPLQRLEHIRRYRDAPNETLDTLEALYVRFLRRTNGGKTELTDRLKNDAAFPERVSADGREFTRQMFNLIQTLGGGRTLHRAIVV